MSTTLPCVRHGVASTEDPRLTALLAAVGEHGGGDVPDALVSLLDYEGQLWATWRDPAARSALADLLSRAWDEIGGERGALHLVRLDDEYDYQEDCMNDASA